MDVREKCVRETSIGCSCRLPIGGLADNPGVCSDWELNQQPLGSQASAQSTEPQQPGPKYLFFIISCINTNVLVVIVFSGFTKCYLWRKLGKGNTGSL